MILWIAEKPSMGKAIAEYLPGAGTRTKTHIDLGENVVTWGFGHLIELAEPKTFNPELEKWKMETLPFFPPEKWEKVVRPDAKEQVAAIAKLLKSATTIVHAGDPDREGQLIVDELLDFLGSRKPVRRLWLAAQDETSVRRALAGLKDNAEYRPMGEAAEARQISDAIVGFNGTRLYTLLSRDAGYGERALFSVGRVQTPTLALVVRRDREIEAFKPVDYFTLSVDVQHPRGKFAAQWKPRPDTPGLDAEGRPLSQAPVQSICDRVQGSQGTIVAFTAKPGSAAPPLPYSLSKLQSAASRKFGLSAQNVLDAAQALYETHKLTSYPRTDCQYLPVGQHADAGAILEALQATNPELRDVVNRADAGRKSKAFNDSKITAHHAIVPTRQRGDVSALSDVQRKVYDLIVTAYLQQFYADHEYLQKTIAVDFGGEQFVATGRTTTKAGWHAVAGDSDPVDEDAEGGAQALPDCDRGDGVSCAAAKVTPRKTKPPARYTDGTLIEAMTSIHKLVDDPSMKARLKETAGIGTEATRASIIETLRKRTFVVDQGKAIVSTSEGRMLIDILEGANAPGGSPASRTLTSPGFTAFIEQNLDQIADGSMSATAFLARFRGVVQKIVEDGKATRLPRPPAGYKPSTPNFKGGGKGRNGGGGKRRAPKRKAA